MIPALPALLIAVASGGSHDPQPETLAMAEAPHALTLEVQARDGMLEVRLVGLSPRAQAVRYTLEVTGASTSRHSGATTLTAGTEAVLSTMRTSASADWCVKLEAQDEGGAPYAITRGACAAG